VTVLVRAQPLSRESFAAFGDVIETEGAAHYTINAGWAERFHDLATLDVTAQSGKPTVSIFRSKPRPLPAALTLMERHCLSSQSFVPLSSIPFLVVVAAAGNAPADMAALHAFVSNGRQGVSYHRGTWHHPLLAIEQLSDFLVIDRIGPEEDCDEIEIVDWDVKVSID
jgi:ureidoglycolate lyase